MENKILTSCQYFVKYMYFGVITTEAFISKSIPSHKVDLGIREHGNSDKMVMIHVSKGER